MYSFLCPPFAAAMLARGACASIWLFIALLAGAFSCCASWGLPLGVVVFCFDDFAAARS